MVDTDTFSPGQIVRVRGAAYHDLPDGARATVQVFPLPVDYSNCFYVRVEADDLPNPEKGPLAQFVFSDDLAPA